MVSEWIEHVKKVAQKKKISYKEALSVAKASYKPKGKKVHSKSKSNEPMKDEMSK